MDINNIFEQLNFKLKPEDGCKNHIFLESRNLLTIIAIQVFEME